jgi:hypothetical protein
VSFRWDVFLSYRRTPSVTAFTTGLLRHALEAKLPNVLGRQPSIFYDTRDIAVGEDWREALGDAHQRSRCVVAVLCGDYFNSAHCRGEFESMYTRQAARVVPVRWGDGHWWSEQGKSLQHTDMERWATFTWGRVKQDRRFLGAVDRVCEAIARASEAAVWSEDAPLLRPEIAPRPPTSLPEIGR